MTLRDQPESTIWSRYLAERAVLVTGLASLFAMSFAALRENRIVAILAALAFAASVIVAGYNNIAKRADISRQDAADERAKIQIGSLQILTGLTCLACAWAAAALLIAYPLAGLRWIHGWEYGVAFALVAGGFAHYLRRLSDRHDAPSQADAVRRAEGLAVIQAVAIALALVWMIASGKLHTTRADWLANDVFLATGGAVFALSVLLLLHLRAIRNAYR